MLRGLSSYVEDAEKFSGFLHYGPRVQGVLDFRLKMVNLQLLIINVMMSGVQVAADQVRFDGDTLVYMSNCEGCWKLYLSIAILAILAIWRLVVYYYYMALRKKLQYKMESTSAAFFSTSRRIWFIVELMIFAFNPYPGCSMKFAMGAIWLCFFRNYIVLRAIRDFSSTYRGRHEMIEAMKRRENGGLFPRVTSRLALKIIFIRRPTLCILLLIILTGGFSTSILYMSERLYWWALDGGPPILGSVWVTLPQAEQVLYERTPFLYVQNSIFFLIVTFTTTGYGDLVPVSNGGRAAACVTAIAGVILTALLISIISQRLEPTSFEQQVLLWANVQSLRTSKRALAATVIQSCFRRYQTKQLLASFNLDEGLFNAMGNLTRGNQPSLEQASDQTSEAKDEEFIGPPTWMISASSKNLKTLKLVPKILSLKMAVKRRERIFRKALSKWQDVRQQEYSFIVRDVKENATNRHMKKLQDEVGELRRLLLHVCHAVDPEFNNSVMSRRSTARRSTSRPSSAASMPRSSNDHVIASPSASVRRHVNLRNPADSAVLGDVNLLHHFEGQTQPRHRLALLGSEFRDQRLGYAPLEPS
eukprot:gb/GEZN01004107.1/.p1 GENE.gb/GEZN01004107.1/~~gb/GEZN01004107.1/.p1  ORF type:complete len:588 (-),score=43.81 gb/GEZN01004107.1/:104-1867(-)